MRWLAWLIALLGIAQYAVLVLVDTADYVSIDMAYLVMWLALLAAAGLWAYSCGWCDYGCGCDHCGECSEGGCCGKCGCAEPGGHSASDGHSH